MSAPPLLKDKFGNPGSFHEKAVPGGMTYTIIGTGIRLYWDIQVGVLMSLRGKSVTLNSGGDGDFSTMNPLTVGKAVMGVL